MSSQIGLGFFLSWFKFFLSISARVGFLGSIVSTQSEDLCSSTRFLLAGDPVELMVEFSPALLAMWVTKKSIFSGVSGLWWLPEEIKVILKGL